MPRFSNDFYINNDWDFSLNENMNNTWNNLNFYPAAKGWRRGKREQSLYWLNPMDYAYSELNNPIHSKSDNVSFSKVYNINGNDETMGEWSNMGSGLMGKVSGLQIMDTKGIEEVVVIGYGQRTTNKSMAYSITSIVIRGMSSLSNEEKSIVIIDGVIYKGDVSKINIGNVTEAMLLKGADATSLYGAEAANGVLILSTKGPIILPQAPPPPIVVRKNFSETAFFFPQVHADEEGFYNFEFTMPESVTEWKWKIFAHTKDAIFSQTEKTIFTQLPLMVQPNMPRFLYQGDKIVLQSRITNLDSTNISGSSYCTIEDAVTGENITAQLSKNVQQNFDVQKKSNSNVVYTITVPENLLHPIKIKITAKAGSFSDGEEHTIPILSKKILVVQNQQIVFSKTDTTDRKSVV